MRKQYVVPSSLTLLFLAATAFRGTAGMLLHAAGVLGGRAEAQAPPYTPVITPNGSTLPFTMEDAVKVFKLTVEPCRHEIAPGMIVNAWCYNGQTPGPTIEAVEGERVRIRSEEHTSELQSPCNLVCRLLLEKKKNSYPNISNCTCS